MSDSETLRALAEEFAQAQETVNGLEYDRNKLIAKAEVAERERTKIAVKLKGLVGSNRRTLLIKLKDSDRLVVVSWSESGTVGVTVEPLL